MLLSYQSGFIDPGTLCLRLNIFLNARFSYCPLIWIFHDRNPNAKVNNIHEGALRIAYKNTQAGYEGVLKLDNAVFVHQRNPQYLMTEIYKAKSSLNPSFMRELFKPRDLQ